MATIPEKATKTKIETAIETTMYEEGFRPHLGCSQVGKKCKREVWYNFRWFLKRSITARQKRLFNRGHWEELIIINDLIKAGCKVEGINIDPYILAIFKGLFNYDIPPAKQFSKHPLFGHSGGSIDGIVYNLPDAPKTPHLLEAKTYNTRRFNNLKRQTAKVSDLGYYIQMQLYMHFFKLKRALFVATHKDTDERYYERIKYNKSEALEYIKIATYILKSTSPPPKINTDPSKVPCTWGSKGVCDYKEVCHNGALPERNCRTCHYSGLRDNGVWLCERTKKKRNLKKQLKGCKNYKLIVGC